MQVKNNIVKVPSQFRFMDSFHYPSDNFPDFEFWLSMHITDAECNFERKYLPITWTAFYKKHRYGKNTSGIRELQLFLDLLDKDEKYFSVIQWDDGCLNDISHLDIKMFSMSGLPMDYPLPLICQPHEYVYPQRGKRNIYACFMGAITHPVRQKIIDIYKPFNRFVTSQKMPLPTYCDVISQSVFSLCPRGYGATSFRIMESLQYGAIPVYISDVHIEPHGIPFGEYGIIIDSSLADNIPECLSLFSPERIRQLQENGKRIYNNYYTFEANKELILKNLQ